jgi:5,5'-dehydrodivanillate O-demethylase
MTIAPPAPTTEGLNPFATGPGTPAGRYLRAFWQPVRLAEDLPPGQAQPLAILGEQYTLYRGVDGRAVVIAPWCPHRLTTLSVGTVEGDAIRCFAHGWKFAPDGQCVEAPGQNANTVRRAQVRTYPTREAFGLVFAYLGDGTEPPFPDIAAYSRAHGRDLASAPILDNSTYRRNCNYYLNVENSLDLAHPAFTHRLSADPTLTPDGFAARVGVIRDFTVERLDFGVQVVEVDDDGERSESTVLLPNTMHLIVGQRLGTLEQIAWRVPIDDDKHQSFGITALHTSEDGARQYRERKVKEKELLARYPPSEECAEQVLRGEKTLRDFLHHPHLIAIEDAVGQMGMQMGMRAVAHTAKEQLGQTDKGVAQLRRMFMSRMAQYLAGDPTATVSW